MIRLPRLHPVAHVSFFLITVAGPWEIFTPLPYHSHIYNYGLHDKAENILCKEVCSEITCIFHEMGT